MHHGEPLLGLIRSREHALFCTKEQGASHKILLGAGARSTQIIILEKGEQKNYQRRTERRKILQRNREQEKNPVARKKITKE